LSSIRKQTISIEKYGFNITTLVPLKTSLREPFLSAITGTFSDDLLVEDYPRKID